MRASAQAAARVGLSRLSEPADAGLGRLVRELGPQEVLARITDASLRTDRLGDYRARLATLDIDADLAVAAQAGARLVVPDDEEWPPALDDLGDEAPLVLWVAGDPDLARITARSVAVVGARACTAYGAQVAGELAAGLCDRGWSVVSGGAFGIDAAAHRAALAVDGVTVAVLACGVDLSYPTAHSALLARVRERGAVVTELPPGSHPTRLRFLQRNRLIAALARGTVVVEAALRSGARNTAGHADGLSRPVMAVPGPVTSTSSGGCHEMIRNQGATLVTDAAEVLDLVGTMGVDALPERRGETRPGDGLDPVSLRVLESLPMRRWAAPDSVATAAGLDAPRALRGLALLASAGLAESRDGVWRRVAPSPLV